MEVKPRNHRVGVFKPIRLPGLPQPTGTVADPERPSKLSSSLISAYSASNDGRRIRQRVFPQSRVGVYISGGHSSESAINQKAS